MSLLISLSIVIAADIFLILFGLGRFWPQQPNPLINQLFDVYRQNIIPERDVLYYHVFLITAMGVFLIAFWKRTYIKEHYQQFKYFVVLETMMVLLMAFFLIKFLLWREMFWLIMFYGCMIIGVVVKIFWPEVYKLMNRFIAFIDHPPALSYATIFGLVSLFCFLVLGLRDPQGAAAKIFIGEQFHHMNWFLVPAAWAHLMGNILDVDTISRYGLGAPVLVGRLANLLPQGFNYTNVMIVLSVITIVYFIVWFHVIKKFLNSIGWAVLVLIWGIKFQMFHTETLPFALTYPQVTPLRCLYDVIVFWLMISFLSNPKGWKLVLAGIFSGVAIYHILGDGLYLTAAFLFFIMMLFIIRYLKINLYLMKISHMVMLIALPFITFVFLALIFAGKHVLTTTFWQNQIEFIRFYQAGHGSQPLMLNLNAGNFFIGIWPFVLPLLYIISLLIVFYRILMKNFNVFDLVVATMSVYLLVAFHYHATVSNNTTAFLRNGIVMALIAVYWLKEWVAFYRFKHQRYMAVGIMLGAFCLFTTHMFLIYPNVINLSKNPLVRPVISHNPPGRASYFNHLFVSYPDNFKLPLNNLGNKDEKLLVERDFNSDLDLKKFYQQESDYSKDAALIQALTKPTDKVPIIASFEPLILMQANRAPFFYTFELLNARPRHMRHWSATLIYTVNNLKRELERLDTLKPEYLFIEKVYLQQQVPSSYLRDMQDTLSLITEIFRRYEVHQAGEFLVALKRKIDNE